MKKWAALLLVVTMVLGLVGCVKQEAKTDSDYEQIKANGKVVVGITDFAPMDYKDENGEWTGFDAELARAVFGKLDLEVEFSEIEWDSKIMELNAGSIDCVWNGMTLTDEVLAAMDCSDPYVRNAQVVILPSSEISDGMTEESVADLSFAVESGSAGASVAEEAGFESIIEVSTQANALMEVAANTSDACIIDLTMANAMTGEGTSYEDLAIALYMAEEQYGIGFRKGSDLPQMVNEILADMRADGSLQKLAEKYDLSLTEG